VIVAENLSKAFHTKSRKTKNTVQAVQSVSFVAENAKITGLLGQNGAGKSTTLRMLATLLPADSGSANIDGYDVQTDPYLPAPYGSREHIVFCTIVRTVEA